MSANINVAKCVVAIAFVCSLCLTGCSKVLPRGGDSSVLLKRLILIEKIRQSLSGFCNTYGQPPSALSELNCEDIDQNVGLMFSTHCCTEGREGVVVDFVVLEPHRDGGTHATFVSVSGNQRTLRFSTIEESQAFASRAITECVVLEDGELVLESDYIKWTVLEFGSCIETVVKEFDTERLFEDGTRVIVHRESDGETGTRRVISSNGTEKIFDFVVDHYGVICKVTERSAARCENSAQGP